VNPYANGNMFIVHDVYQAVGEWRLDTISICNQSSSLTIL